METVKFHFDPLCPWCYQTSRWARRLEELGELELDWGVFSLEVVNLPDDDDPRQLEARAAPALRTAIVIRDQAGSRAIGPFYAALGRRIWDHAHWLTRYGNFSELKRHRLLPPDLPTAAWWREQRAKDKTPAT